MYDIIEQCEICNIDMKGKANKKWTGYGEKECIRIQGFIKTIKLYFK